MKKKINPRRRPTTEADVKRAKQKASDDAVRLVLAVCLTVMCDDFNFTKEQMQFAWSRLEKLTEEIEEGRISAWDLVNVLRDEYEIILS